MFGALRLYIDVDQQHHEGVFGPDVPLPPAPSASSAVATSSVPADDAPDSKGGSPDIEDHPHTPIKTARTA